MLSSAFFEDKQFMKSKANYAILHYINNSPKVLVFSKQYNAVQLNFKFKRSNNFRLSFKAQQKYRYNFFFWIMRNINHFFIASFNRFIVCISIKDCRFFLIWNFLEKEIELQTKKFYAQVSSLNVLSKPFWV